MGCDVFDDEDMDVSGEYTTETFLAIVDGEQVDVLDAGGNLEMSLDANGSFDGHIFIPKEVLGAPDTSDTENPDTTTVEDIDEDLAGTYDVSGDLVTFATGTDLFIGGAPWLFADNRLRWSSNFILVVLSRQ